MRKRLSPGMILGVFAVVLACTGTAAAGSLITSGKIKDGTIQGRDIKKGTITTDRLSTGIRRELKKVGTPGPKGDTGATGATGAPGPTLQGAQRGDAGAPGKDAANPATLVNALGDSGWVAMGGGSYPAASIVGGALHLQGGFDGSTPSGGIGVAQDYSKNPVALSSLKTLSYDFRITKRPANAANAPVIHITVLGAATGTASGFTNFVFEPYQQGATPGLNQPYSFDATAGKWWATRATGGIDQNHPASWADVINTNKDAKIQAISIDNGGSSGANTIPGDQFAADVDNVVLGFGSDFTRFDFGG